MNFGSRGILAALNYSVNGGTALTFITDLVCGGLLRYRKSAVTTSTATPRMAVDHFLLLLLLLTSIIFQIVLLHLQHLPRGGLLLLTLLLLLFGRRLLLL